MSLPLRTLRLTIWFGTGGYAGLIPIKMADLTAPSSGTLSVLGDQARGLVGGHVDTRVDHLNTAFRDPVYFVHTPTNFGYKSISSCFKYSHFVNKQFSTTKLGKVEI